jgi:uncharacterized membrane protein YeaQ/YmgE (transglycosylase-associated protein family)
MVSNKMGWLAVVLAVVGALTAGDVMPLLSTVLTETLGAKVAHTVATLLALVGAVVAKLSPPSDPPAA